MPKRIQVKMPVVYDPDVVGAVLGDEPLPIDVADRVLAPFVTIDGRIHGPTSDFLRRHTLSRPNTSTAMRIASDLAAWLDFLCNDCELPLFEDYRDPVFTATEDHFARYYRQLAGSGDFTIGNVFITRRNRRSISDRLLAHEAKHADQWATIGPAFGPMYVTSYVVSGGCSVFDRAAGYSDGNYDDCASKAGLVK